MQNFDLKKIIEWLGYFLKCPVCGVKYSVEQTKIIESKENEPLSEANILVHSDCVKCKSSVMFNIEVKGPDVFSVGMLTDLTGDDSKRFKKLDALSTNDVINIHSSLKNFKGDFITAINKK